MVLVPMVVLHLFEVVVKVEPFQIYALLVLLYAKPLVMAYVSQLVRGLKGVIVSGASYPKHIHFHGNFNNHMLGHVGHGQYLNHNPIHCQNIQ